MQTTLATLRDIEGVLGSFLIDESGQLLARDMPGVFDDETLNSASQRLSRLRGAFESEVPSFGGCVARFGEHLLVVRPVARQLLCVLVPRGANLTALQMGTNLVSRRLASASASSAAPAPVAVSASLVPPTHAPSAPIPTPAASRPRPIPSEASPATTSAPPALPSTMPAPAEPPPSGVSPMLPISAAPPAPTAFPPLPPPPNTTIALLARTKLAPSDHQSQPTRDSTPLVDPHPTRPLPKRFFRGRPVD